VKFAVEPWSPEYGAAGQGDALRPTDAAVSVDIEVPIGEWGPRRPGDVDLPDSVLITDGVRRIDAWIWIQDDEGRSRPGICASYAAGAVRCDGEAHVVGANVERGLFTPAPDAEGIKTRHADYAARAAAGESPEELSLALQQRMGELEVALAHQLAGEAELILVDGPLTGRQNIPGAVGYTKSQVVAYLPPALTPVIGALGPGERTPLFVTTGNWSRFSWYLRLAAIEGHSWAGVVRCEVSADLNVSDAVRIADVTAALLPRFASAAHKDARAPQNLYPIGGLERELRRRLGDAQLLYRALRSAARAA
jgi:hypothetical protein